MTDLITLAQAHQYLKIPDATTGDDGMIQALIDGASAEFLTLTSLPYIGETSFTERRNGTGTSSITTRNRPLQTISSLVINNVTVKASPDGVQPGYYFEPGGIAIYLVGGYGFFNREFAAIGFQGYPGRFIKGFGNVFITGTAGYPNTSASVAATIPQPAQGAQVSYYTNPAFDSISISAGATVTNINTGQPLTQVQTGPTATGEFVLTPTGTFVFWGADAATPIQILYSAIGIPLDIQKCIYEMVGWAYKNRDRIGIGTERFADNLSQSYRSTPFSEMSRKIIQQYTRKDAVGW